jgi:hypothetical protein
VTPGWVAAGVLLTVLTLGLTVLVLRLLGAVSSLDSTVAQHHRQLAQRAGEPADTPGTPSSVLVLLEPSLADHRSLAADIRASGGLPVGLPTRLRVSESAAGRALVADFPVPVEFETRSVPMTAGAPSALVLDRSGRVVAGGTPSSVAALRTIVAEARSPRTTAAVAT